jgi:hypothetical protein
MGIIAAVQHWPVQAIAAMIAGIVILLVPRVLNYAIAAYLLLVGVLGLLPLLHGYGVRPPALIALVAGVLVLVRPNIVSYVVGIYLILIGLLQSGILRI